MQHIITKDGDEYWLNKKGNFHREDGGPSYIYTDGIDEWHKNGKLHRKNSPAYIDVDGSEHWIIENKFHRLGGPAVIYIGIIEWHENGKLIK